MTDVAGETITCGGCGNSFGAVVILSLDPVRHREFTENDELMRRLSRIQCPECGWAEMRPIPIRYSGR